LTACAGSSGAPIGAIETLQTTASAASTTKNLAHVPAAPVGCGALSRPASTDGVSHLAAPRRARDQLDDLAALTAGDTFVAECASAPDGRYRAEGDLAVLGTSGHAVAAELAFGVDSVSARVVGATVDPEEKGAFGMSLPTDGEVDQPAFGPVLERLGVTVGVEIARRRMTIGELLALGPGSVVEMDVPIRNSVTLLADGSPFARGELVDADGRLAVRVLALGGRQ
jgi:flagellar motor switch protein FliN/FliY